MSRIDDIFKKGLQQGIPFEPRHWDDMEALIVRKAKARKRLIWLSAILLVSTLSVGVMYRFFNKTLVNQVVVQDVERGEEIVKTKVIPQISAPLVGEEESPESWETTVKEEVTQASNVSADDESLAYEQNSDVPATEVEESAVEAWVVRDSENPEDIESDPLEEVVVNASEVEGSSIVNTDKFYLDGLRWVDLKNEWSLMANSIHWSLPKHPAKSRWYLSGGMTYVMPNLSKLAGVEISTQEETLNSVGLNLDVQRFKGRWGIGSGLSSYSIKERTNYLNSNTTYTYDTSLVLVTKSYTTDPRGKSIGLLEERIDSTGTTTEQVDCPDCLVAIRYLRIPLNAVYRQPLSKHWFVQGGLGLGLNVFTGGQGAYAGPTPITQANVNRLLIDQQASVRVQYKINAWQIWMGASLSRSRQSMLVSRNQHFNRSGLHIGVGRFIY